MSPAPAASTLSADAPEEAAVREVTLRLMRFRRASDLARARRLRQSPRLAGLVRSALAAPVDRNA